MESTHLCIMTCRDIPLRRINNITNLILGWWREWPGELFHYFCLVLVFFSSEQGGVAKEEKEVENKESELQKGGQHGGKTAAASPRPEDHGDLDAEETPESGGAGQTGELGSRWPSSLWPSS